MAAILKLSNEKVEELCRMHQGVYPVNYNCPGQLVVAGLKSSLGGFIEDVAANGGKAVPAEGERRLPFARSWRGASDPVWPRCSAGMDGEGAAGAGIRELHGGAVHGADRERSCW